MKTRLPSIIFRFFLPSLLLLIPSICLAVDVGESAGDFKATTIDGEEVSLKDLSDKTVVLEWFNKGCPFVRKHYKNGDMQALQKEFTEKGVVWVAVNSTSKTHADYQSPEDTKKILNDYNVSGVKFVLDVEGEIGRLYGAKTTPHMFIIDKGKLVYRGAIDDDSDAYADPKKSHNHVRAALKELLENKQISKSETAPYGCSVKYAN